jgi:hypothetical protein
VQQQYPGFYPQATKARAQLVCYAFRIDPAGVVQEPRILSAVAPAIQAASLQALKQLPAFEPAY